ncbi:MAG TPA: hypothetical protein VNV14_01965 [Opitutaceae bacterium]|nr:hypothetical protein [Opitutaceae bacterium]
MSDGGIALMLALAISAVLLGMPTPITQAMDYQTTHQFYKFYLRASIRAGDWPLWNPFVALGRPFLADPEAAVFYPPNWIFILLPELSALFVFLVFHFWLAGFFFLRLARRWTVPRSMAIGWAFAYMLSGPVMGRLQGGQLDYFCGLAYWPLLFYLVERWREKPSLRGWVALVLAASGSFLCGHPQCFWLTAVALGFYLVGAHLGSPWRENARHGLLCLGALVGAYAFALLLCAVQLLPIIELIRESNRTVPSIQFSASGSMDPRFLTSLYFFQPDVLWEVNLSIGLVCTAVGLLGLGQWRDARVRGLFLMGAIGFVLALGQGTPLFAAIFHVLPGMGSFRLAARFALFLPWALLLAGLIAWAKWKPPHWTRTKAAASGALLILLGVESLVAAAQMWASYTRFLVDKPRDAEVVNVLHGKNLYPANGVPPRLFVPNSLIHTNGGMEFGFSSVGSYSALTSARVWNYLYLGAGMQVPSFQVSYLSKYIYRAGPFPFPGMNIAVGGVYGSSELFLNPHPGERAYLVHAWKQMPDWKSALQQMVQNHSDPTMVALLEAPAEGPSPTASDPSSDEAVIDAFHRNSIELHVYSSAPALLVVAEAWYPGWRATVNGVPAEVLPANVWMRAVCVPAGESRVELHYVEPSLARGAVISLCALLVLVAIGWRGWTQERSVSVQPLMGESSR